MPRTAPRLIPMLGFALGSLLLAGCRTTVFATLGPTFDAHAHGGARLVAGLAFAPGSSGPSVDLGYEFGGGIAEKSAPVRGQLFTDLVVDAVVPSSDDKPDVVVRAGGRVGTTRVFPGDVPNAAAEGCLLLGGHAAVVYNVARKNDVTVGVGLDGRIDHVSADPPLDGLLYGAAVRAEISAAMAGGGNVGF